MTEGFEKISRIQDEILGEVWQVAGDNMDSYYIEGLVSVSEDNSGMIDGRLAYGVKDNELFFNTKIGLEGDSLSQLNRFILDKIEELYYALNDLQGKSPCRFRWHLDVKTNKVDSDWTYYENLTDEELQDDTWSSWKGDEIWEAQIREELLNKRK